MLRAYPCFSARAAPGLVLDVLSHRRRPAGRDVYLQNVELPASSRLGPEGEALAAVDAALDIGLAALCADAVGVMQALVDATVDYVRQRQQFGQPIGRFQALQHPHRRHADPPRAGTLDELSCRDALLRRGCRRAPAGIVGGQGGDWSGWTIRWAAGGAAARRMGMTDELKVSHWFKRLTPFN